MTVARAADPLPSWNDGPAKQAIAGFVTKATQEGAPDFIPPAERIATFDQDGTLWVEQPIVTEVIFAMDRVAALAPGHPEWKEQEPYQSILTGDRAAMEKFTFREIEEIIAATHTGMTFEEFQAIVKDWLAKARHPKLKRPFTECVYQPMLEWTGAGGGARLMMLVHHDDAEREFDYGAKSKIGTFSEALMVEAKQAGWTVVSMKNDWKRIFAAE